MTTMLILCIAVTLEHTARVQFQSLVAVVTSLGSITVHQKQHREPEDKTTSTHHVVCVLSRLESAGVKNHAKMLRSTRSVQLSHSC